MTQQRCNTPGGIDQNESVSQQSRKNKNINFQKNKITNSRQRWFFIFVCRHVSNSQKRTIPRKLMQTRTGRTNRYPPPLLRNRIMYPWRQLLVVSLHRRHHDTNRIILIGDCSSSSYLFNLFLFICRHRHCHRHRVCVRCVCCLFGVIFFAQRFKLSYRNLILILF